MASLSIVLSSTGTILRRKGNGGSQKREERKVKTRTLENREDAAPKFAIGLQGCATRLHIATRMECGVIVNDLVLRQS